MCMILVSYKGGIFSKLTGVILMHVYAKHRVTENKYIKSTWFSSHALRIWAVVVCPWCSACNNKKIQWDKHWCIIYFQYRNPIDVGWFQKCAFELAGCQDSCYVQRKQHSLVKFHSLKITYNWKFNKTASEVLYWMYHHKLPDMLLSYL